MADLLLFNARVIDPEGPDEFNGAVLVKNGKIAEIVKTSKKADTDAYKMKHAAAMPFDCKGKVLAPGIVDIGVKVCEPGERHKESFRTAGAAAAAGGVTTMVTRPDTIPCIDTPETLEYALRRGNEMSPVKVEQIATLTKGREGREMVELGFLRDAGAVAFSDGDNVIQDSKIMVRALSYAASMDALVMGHPQEPSLSKGAAMTSGKFATLLGISGVSPMAERMGLERDMALVEATGVSYHVDQISTAGALPALVRAKSDGLNVTAGASIHHLTLNTFDVGDYRTFFKVKPPLRDESDRVAIGQAVADGTIDIISSMHTPQDEESKRQPFEEAASGAVGLETLLPAAMRLVHAGVISLPALWRTLSLNPAQRLGLDRGAMKKGSPADLVLFDPDAPFVLDRMTLRSKSKNTPFDGERMEGRVICTWVDGKKVFEA